MEELIESKKQLISPDGYKEVRVEIGLFYTDESSVDGKHWFLRAISSPASKTWLSKMEAQVFISNSIMDDIIKEENNGGAK